MPTHLFTMIREGANPRLREKYTGTNGWMVYRYHGILVYYFSSDAVDNIYCSFIADKYYNILQLAQ